MTDIQLPKLNAATQKVVEHCITTVLEDYTTQTKLFTADTLHSLRSEITQKVKEILGDDIIENIDVVLDLSELETIPMGFRIRVPKEAAEEHILSTTSLDD